jgi:hypothetical protein
MRMAGFGGFLRLPERRPPTPPSSRSSRKESPMPKVTFEVESEAEPLLIVSARDAAGQPVNRLVDLMPAGATKRTGSLTVSSNQTQFLNWIFVGNPGTKYKITLTPQAKVKIRRSKNPIESSIATTRPVASGSDQFEVVP